MKPYLDIINHFGIRAQMKKFNEEAYELIEAIDNYEELYNENECYNTYSDDELRIFKEHIAEEIADVLIMVTQFIAKYDVKQSELDDWIKYKMERIKFRIENGYYEDHK